MLNTLTSAGIPPTGGIRLTQPCPLRSHRCDTFLQKVGAPWDWPDHQDRVQGVWGQCTSWNPRCRPRWPMRTPFPLLIPRSCFCPPTPTPTTQTSTRHLQTVHRVLEELGKRFSKEKRGKGDRNCPKTEQLSATSWGERIWSFLFSSLHSSHFPIFLQRIYILCTTKMFIFKRLKTNHILLLGPDSNSSLFMMFSLTYPTQNNPSCDRILIRIKITNHN